MIDFANKMKPTHLGQFLSQVSNQIFKFQKDEDTLALEVKICR